MTELDYVCCDILTPAPSICVWPRKQARVNVCVQWLINQSLITVCRVAVESTVFRSDLSSGDFKQQAAS